LRIELSSAINTIGVLLGRNPGAFSEELSKIQPIPLPPKKITVGIPADLLRQRPDIRRAERELAAQTARIGIAKADLYPRFSLNGTFGLTAIESENLFESDSRAYSFGPAVRWNLFDGNRIRNQVKVEDARTEQALLRYEKTVLDALNETENAFTAYREERLRLEALERTVVAARRTVKLSTELYKQGLTDFQNVLDAQRALFVIENQLAEAKGKTVTILVGLYKALGGGWEPEGERQTALGER
jgi:NodT family efflux transporter outer membrane factor (OMF) lipoprotein